ncbi:MAG: DUF1848 domain-containing protein [bacterium]
MSFKGWDQVVIRTKHGDVAGIAPVIISASRATDIPALYPEWFMHRLRSGYVKWINRFSGRPTYVSFEKTRAIVFWTKNASPIMEHLPEIEGKKINYYFTFTLNDYEREGLEPNLLPLASRTAIFKRLSDRIGRHRVVWRVDPLILSRTLTPERILSKIYGVGREIHDHTEKLVISFIDIRRYKKVIQNLAAAGLQDVREFTQDSMIEIARGLQEMGRQWNLAIATCAETIDLSPFGIGHNKCIDDGIMRRAFGGDAALLDFLGPAPETPKDPGQRPACGCIPSKDIGQYNTCKHLCAYCYANSSPKAVRENFQRHKSCPEFSEAILSD